MVPNVAGIIANSPVLANIFVPLFEGVHGGTFTEAEIQTLLLTNAVTNSCAWAVAFHSYLALKAGLNPADVEAIRATPRAAGAALRRPLGIRPQPDRPARPCRRRGGRRPSCPPASNAEQALETLAVTAASTITNYTLNIAEPPLEPMFQEHAWRA